jgi:hypothetical protein
MKVKAESEDDLGNWERVKIDEVKMRLESEYTDEFGNK